MEPVGLLYNTYFNRKTSNPLSVAQEYKNIKHSIIPFFDELEHEPRALNFIT